MQEPTIPHAEGPRTEVTAPNRSPRTTPERNADPTRGLQPPSRRTPEVDEGKELAATRKAGAGSIFQGPLVRAAMRESFKKLDPRHVAKNPVMFVVEVGAAITTVVLLLQIATRTGNIGFTLQISLWLWFTVVFANFAEAVAEACGKAQADTLRATRKETPARRARSGGEAMVSSSTVRKVDDVIVRVGESIPVDGEVIEGIAYVNEAAITGESAQVLKEPGTDIRSSVAGGTQIVSDSLRIQISADPGETFLDRMIALVEGAVRHKTPNEIALSILLAGLTIVFLFA